VQAGVCAFSLTSRVAQRDTRTGDGQYGQPGISNAGQPGSPDGTATDVVRGNGYGSWAGTWGPGAVGSDDALDLLNALSGQDTAARRQVQSGSSARPGSTRKTWTSRSARPRSPPRPRSWQQACQSAGRPAGGAVAQEITGHDYDVTALVIPGSDPELAGAALAALLIAAGHDGAWHRDWTDPRTAPQARRTTDQLASVFYRHQHRHDQELPLEP